MNSGKQNRVGTSKASSFYKIERMHPVKMLLYLSMVGMGVLFLILVIAYAQTSVLAGRQSYVPFPKFFSISTIIILLSSYTISFTPRFYRKDNLKRMQRYLGVTLLLAVLFVISQVIGWQEISAKGLPYKSRTAGGYIYLITALHLLHVLGGMIFLGYLFLKTLHASSDAVRGLIYIRDPFRTMQIKMLCKYWHFMDLLWVFLYVVFLFIF